VIAFRKRQIREGLVVIVNHLFAEVSNNKNSKIARRLSTLLNFIQGSHLTNCFHNSITHT